MDQNLASPSWEFPADKDLSPNLPVLSKKGKSIGIAKAATGVLTVSKAIKLYAAWREQQRPSAKTPCKYPRIARAYLEWCLEQGYSIDEMSVNMYTADKRGNIVFGVRNFLEFASILKLERVVPNQREDYQQASRHAFILYYIGHKKNLRGELSHQTYLTGLNRFFDYMETTGGSFDGRTLDAFVRDMLSGRLVKQEGGPHVEKEFSSFTINCYLSAVRGMAKWILEENHLLPSPFGFTEEQLREAEGCLLVKSLQQEKRFYKDALDEGERDLLLSQAENSRERSILELMAFCGLRTIEVTRLYRDDLDFNKHVLQVRRKGRHSKSQITLFENCHATLKAYLAEEQPKGLLFGELKTWQIRKLVNHCLESAGLKTKLLSAHSLRHTAAQIMLNKGFSNTQVQLQLGHSSYETTLFYTRKQEEKQWRTRTSI